MSRIKIPRPWDLPEDEITSEEIYLGRREFLKTLTRVGLSAAALVALPPLPGVSNLWASMLENTPTPFPHPGELTPESIASRYNNFYEFGTHKEQLWRLAERLETRGWTIEVGGLVDKPQVIDVETLIRQMPLEERVYRLHCVEAWAMVIPWTGFPLRRLIDRLSPQTSARFVKFTTFLNPNIAPGQKTRFWEPWPYTEGLSLKEARHELSFLATGVYGRPLPPQHGAPIRLVVPWKHGFKSIKSIVRIEFTRDPPETFWQTMSPLEYDFWANVNPEVPYARWDQRFERIPGKEEMVRTKPYNGYAAEVGHLYA